MKRNEVKDLVTLLIVLTTMTMLLCLAIRLLVGFDLSYVDGWLISGAALLLYKRKRLGIRTNRRRETEA